MRSIAKKKTEKIDAKKIAQCCAKTSNTIVGCHD